jgi:hypothetical protein
MAKLLTDMYKFVEPELPGCPQPLILQTFKEILQEFCEESQAWRFELDLINVRDGVSEYELLGQPSSAYILVPVKVRMPNKQSEDQEMEAGVDYDMTDRTTLKLKVEPQEDDASGLYVKVALTPKDDAQTICDDLWIKHYKAWAHGVKGRLMLMDGKKWSNEKKSAYHNSMYWDGITKAKIDVSQGGMNQELQCRPKYRFA